MKAENRFRYIFQVIDACFQSTAAILLALEIVVNETLWYSRGIKNLLDTGMMKYFKADNIGAGLDNSLFQEVFHKGGLNYTGK